MHAERRTTKTTTTKPQPRDGSVHKVSSKNVSSREPSKERGISSDRSKTMTGTKASDSKTNQRTLSKVKPTTNEPSKSRITTRDTLSKERPTKTMTSTTKPSVLQKTKVNDNSSLRSKESAPVRNSVSRTDTLAKALPLPKGGDKKVPMKAVHSEQMVANSSNNYSVSNSASKDTGSVNAQKDVNKSRTGHRQRTRTRTLSPSESMLLSTTFGNLVSQDGSIEAQKEIQSEEKDDDQYDDDFEDYESDFEDVTENKEFSHVEDSHSNSETEDFSSDISDMKSSNQNTIPEFTSMPGNEERKLDSGHYDISTNSSKKFGGNNGSVTQTIPARNDSSKIAQGSGDLVSTDEGFVDDKQLVIHQNIIDFSQARKIHNDKMLASSVNERGRTLLQMIRLDSQSFCLFDEAPVPYDVYMRIYGRKNTLQAYSQTGEETLSEETQTDRIISKNKWIQHPPNHSTSGGQLLKLSQLACGSDPMDVEADWNEWKQQLRVDLNQLEEFVVKAGQVVLILLEESNEEDGGKLRSNKMDLGFSAGFIALGVDSVPFLADREVSHISFVPLKPTYLLSVHRSAQTIKHGEKESNETVDCLRRCILCLWNLRSPSSPLRMLLSSADVTSLCVHPSSSSLIFCGLSDGVVCAWDLKEKSTYHRNVSYREKKWVLQPATYSTAHKREERGHTSQVIGIRALEPHKDEASNEGELKPTQVVSVEASGHLIVWTVLRASSGKPVDDLGLACWGNVRLVHSASFNASESFTSPGDEIQRLSLQCTSLESDGGDPAHFYVTTNTGNILHFVAVGKAWPPAYLPANESFVPATCISHCPFGMDFFLVGCDEGSVGVYKCGRERPLLTVAGTGDPPGCGGAIRALHWSRTRPCVFFALDVASRLHVWDLGISDMYPIISVPFKGKVISALGLSPRVRNKQFAYLALGTSCGRIKVHQLSAELGNPSPNQVAQELDKFVRYRAYKQSVASKVTWYILYLCKPQPMKIARPKAASNQEQPT